MPLGLFRRMSRRALAAGALAFIMTVVVIHDVPAAAAPPPTAEEAPVDAQELVITEATLEVVSEKVPLSAERDGFSMSYYTPVQWPVDPSSPLTSYFGPRAAPCAACSSYHHGIDYTPGYGAAVHAIADGVVVSRNISGLGTFVTLQHTIDGMTVYSVYGHLVAGSNTPVGTHVRMGDVIGRAGNTGDTSGPHLHLAIMLGDYNFIDPLPWMKRHVTEAWAG